MCSLLFNSREKTHLDDLIDDRMVNQLLKFTGIAPDLLRKNLTDQIHAGKFPRKLLRFVAITHIEYK